MPEVRPRGEGLPKVRPEVLYLDHAASAPVAPEAVEAMLPWLAGPDGFGNPASEHAYGARAAAACALAREQVAAMLGADPDGIVWTSGATESVHLAIGGCASGGSGRFRAVSSPLEHGSVLGALERVRRQGGDVRFADVGLGGAPVPDGVLEALSAGLDPPLLASFVHVNNETGAVLDIEGIAAVLDLGGTLLHVDAAQSPLRVSLQGLAESADMVTLSAHKMGGPKGIGALWVSPRARAVLEPMLPSRGGDGDLRPGTVPVHLAVGFGAAAERISREGADLRARLEGVDRTLCQGAFLIEGSEVNGPSGLGARALGILNLWIEGVDSRALRAGVAGAAALSGGSACGAAGNEPSHVLLGMGLGEERAASSVRVSAGPDTPLEGIREAMEALGRTVRMLRELG